MDMIEVELLKNPTLVKLVSVPGHSKLSIAEMLECKFAFKEITYALEQGEIVFNRPNPLNVETTSNESADKSMVNNPNTFCYNHVLKRQVKLTELGYRIRTYLERTDKIRT